MQEALQQAEEQESEEEEDDDNQVGNQGYNLDIDTIKEAWARYRPK